MNGATTKQMLDTLTAASAPADLFGPIGGSARAAKRTFRIYAGSLHPDRATAAGLDTATSAAAFERLTALYEQWTTASNPTAPADTASAATIVVNGQQGTYTLTLDPPTEGTVSALYRARSAEGAFVMVKIPRTHTSNRFLTGERAALQKLAGFTAAAENRWLTPYFPQLVDTLDLVSDSHPPRSVNVLQPLGSAEGFVDLATVVSAFPTGLDGRDWAWIHRRLLRAIAGAHAAGVTHGAILPENVLIHPADHGVALVGWSFSSDPGAALPGRVASQAAAYPPHTEPASTALDVYMTHALMTKVLSLDEVRQRSFAAGCMQTAPGMRPDAVELLAEYDELLENMYGQRRFRQFPYTVTT